MSRTVAKTDVIVELITFVMRILNVSGAESLSEMQVAHLFRRSKGPQFGGSDLEER